MHQRRDIYVNSFGTLVILNLITQIENKMLFYWESWASSDVRIPMLEPELLLAATGLFSSNWFEVFVPADNGSRRWEDQPGSGRICSLRSFWLCYDREAILEICLLCYSETAVQTCKLLRFIFPVRRILSSICRSAAMVLWGFVCRAAGGSWRRFFQFGLF